MPEAVTLSAPPAGSAWHILDVMRWGKGHPRNAWVALLIDVDPVLHLRGQQSFWLDLGRHRNRDEAWEIAEALLATRH